VTTPTDRAARRHPPKQMPAYPRTSTPPSELLTTREACAYLRVGRTTLRQLAADGLLHPIRLGMKLLRWDPADLDGVLR
jgi:excisionase family DNA binding protein